MDGLGQLEITGTQALRITSNGVIMNGETLDMTNGEIHKVPLIHGPNNQDLVIEGKGTGDVVLKTNNVNRIAIADNGNIAMDTNVLFVDGVNNRVGVNQSTPQNSLHISNGDVFIEGSGRSLYLGNNSDASSPRLRLFALSAGGDSYIDWGTGTLRFRSGTGSLSERFTCSSTQFSIASGLNVNIDSGTLYVDATNNRIGLGTTSPAQVLDVNGNIALTTTGVVHTSQTSNQHLGFTNTQSSGTADSLFGCFRRTSGGWQTVSNGALFFDIGFSGGGNNLFTPSSIDNCGGVLNIYLKKTASSRTFGIFQLLVTKIGGTALKDAYTVINSRLPSFSATPTIGGGTGDVIRINFVAADTTSPAVMNVAWSFEGAV
jgi:hypothetical protein